MNEGQQIACGAALSGCSAWLAHALEWLPVLQLVAVIVAITSGIFAIAVSAHKLYVAWRDR